MVIENGRVSARTARPAGRDRCAAISSSVGSSGHLHVGPEPLRGRYSGVSAAASSAAAVASASGKRSLSFIVDWAVPAGDRRRAEPSVMVS